jgi:hypothetical protein
MAFQTVRLFLRTLVRFLRNESYESFSRTLTHLSAFEKIELTQRVYFRVPKAEVKLMSVFPGNDGIQSMTLSIDDAKQIFQSIELAYDRHEMVEMKVGDLSWTTDCRIQSDPDKVIVAFSGPSGRTRVGVRRQDLAAAVANFAARFETK